MMPSPSSNRDALSVRIALSYSQEAERLVRHGTLDADLFLCPAASFPPEGARLPRPVQLHFALYAGHLPGRSAADLDRPAALFARTASTYVNVALDPRVACHDGAFAGTYAAIDRVLQDVRRVADRFGRDRVVLENVPYWTGAACPHTRLAAEPDLIRQVVEETGCGLLLNVSHARMAAHALGSDVRNYLARLPLARLRVLYAGGLPLHGGRVRRGLPLAGADRALLPWLLNGDAGAQGCIPEIIACVRDTHPPLAAAPPWAQRSQRPEPATR